ncbi:MAG: hypothetical protein AVDCRST_MAG33-1005, partial [uncultured Thermomicrobiales bacterium]
MVEDGGIMPDPFPRWGRAAATDRRPAVTDTPAASQTDAPSDQSRFVWHPQYRGQTVAEVRAALLDDLRSDQRAYAITIDGPAENESDILVRVV